MQEIRFSVEATRVEDHFSVTLFIHESDEEPEEGDELSCYFLIFRGSAEFCPTDVARNFAECHQKAMDTFKLEGVVSEEEFTERLENSVEEAGRLMADYGCQVIETEDLSEDLARTFEMLRQGDDSAPFGLN